MHNKNNILTISLTFFDLILICNYFDTALLSFSTKRIFIVFIKKSNKQKKGETK